MSTDSCTIDTEDWQGAGVCTIGDVGGGVFGSEIASSGTNGPGYAYNDLSLPADASREICGRITTWPVSGILFAYEDTSFTYVPAGDGVTFFDYQLLANYAPVGTPQRVYLNSGSGAATAPGTILGGVSTIQPGSAAAYPAGTAPGAILTGSSRIQPGNAYGVIPPAPNLNTYTIMRASKINLSAPIAAPINLTGNLL